jgi:hypothetical protein
MLGIVKLESLEFLYGLLCEASLSIGADNFEETATKVADTKKELREEMEKCGSPSKTS